MKKYEIKNTIEEIFERQNEILDNISEESICVYRFLKEEYKKGDIKNNILFQFVFKSFYQLNTGGLGDKLKKKYFELLSNNQNDLKKILLELYEVPRTKNGTKSGKTIQFSFATKLLHTLDNNKPISDTEVLRVFNKKQLGETKKEKIKNRLELYEFLEETYAILLGNEQIKDIIRKFRNIFKVKEDMISDVKALDFILWSLGKLKKVHR